MNKRRPTDRRTKDMLFRLSTRPASFLASVLAAGLMLAVASCGSHLTPLGPAPSAPQPQHLRSPIVLQAMRFQEPTPAGGCPAGFTKLSGPGSGPACYRPLGAPVKITSAAVSPGPTVGPASPSNAPPSGYGLLFALPGSEEAELTAVTTQAADSKGAVDISVAGKIWGLPMTFAPITQGQFEIVLPDKNELSQLQRILGLSG